MPSSTKWFLKDAASSLAISGNDVHTLESTAGSAVVGYIKSTLTGPVTPPTTATQWTKASGGTVAVWVTDPVQSVTFTSGTHVTFNLWAQESASQANATITAELVRLDNSGNVVSTLASCVLSRTELTTSSAVNNWTASIGSTTTLTTGDRLAVRCYVDDGSGVTMAASGRTVTLNIGGGTTGASGDSYVTLPVSITTFTQANVTASDSLTFNDDLNAYAIVSPVVQANRGYSNGASSVTVPFTSNNTAGNAIAVVIGYANGTHTVSSILDSHSNTYQLAVAHAESSANNGFAAIYYATGIASGANSVTVSISSSDAIAVAIYELSGVSALDVTGTADSNASSGAVSTSTATTVNNEIVLAGIFDWNTVTSWTADSAYHLGPSLNSTEFGNSVAFATDYSVSNTAGTQTTTFTGAGGYFSAVIASFKGASSSSNVTASDTLSLSETLQRGIGRTAGDTLSYSESLSRGTAASRTPSTIGTHIQVSGGVDSYKVWYTGEVSSQAGVLYLNTVVIRNNGPNTVQMGDNFGHQATIAAGTTRTLDVLGVGNASAAAQWILYDTSGANNIDVTAFNPCILRMSDGVDLIAAADKTFSTANWRFDSASTTITQGDPISGDWMVYEEYTQTGIGRTASDTTSFSESNSRSTVASRSLTDTVSFSEALSRATAAARTLSDALSFSESIVSQKGIGRTATDSFTTSDSVSRALQIARTITDTQTFNDSVSRTVAIAARLISDTLSLTEQLHTHIGRNLTVSDTLAFSEAVNRSLAAARTALDSLTFGESVLAGNTHHITVVATDTLTLAESLSRAIATHTSLIDALTLSDTATAARGAFLTASDTLSFGESLSRRTVTTAHAADTVSLLESLARQVQQVRAASDSLIFSESTSRSQGAFRVASDTFTVSDTLSRMVTLSRSLSEAYGFSEDLSRLLVLHLFVQDSLSQDDSAVGASSTLGAMIIANLKVIAACIITAATNIEAAKIDTLSVPEGAKIDSAEIKMPQITGVTVNNSSKIDSAEIVHGAVITDVSVKD